MFLEVGGVNAFGAGTPAIQVLVDIRDTVFPDLVFPVGSRQFVFENAVVAVKSRGLSSLLFERHLREKICDALLDVDLWILIDVHAAVLVQIDPAGMIDFFFGWLNLREKI